MVKKLDKPFPKAAGVYFFKDKAGIIIYVGKAKSLKARVTSYFKKTYDWKVEMLIGEHTDVDYILTKNETEALLLEAQMVQEHKPKYNVLLKEGQPFLYILFTSKAMPTIEIVRTRKQKGTYFGPFLYKRQAREVARFLIKTFNLALCNKKIANGCLDYHLGRCSGSCLPTFDATDYHFRINLAQEVLKKDHKKFKDSVKEKIRDYNKQLAFEKSKRLSYYLENLDPIFETIKTRFHEDKYKDEIFVAGTPTQIENYKEVGIELAAFLGLEKPIKTIDCFDISHFQSTYIVGSCIRFTGGMPEKDKFRRFRIRTLTQQNDYAALQEIVSRRYKDGFDRLTTNGFDLPDLIVIDGGKGQLNAVQSLYPQTHFIALAKAEETVYSTQIREGKKLDVKTKPGKILIAIRDYAHHFAVSYHRLRRKMDSINLK